MTQPGWYPDPASSFAVRWWDGQRWTNDSRPATGGGPGVGLDPHADLANETSAGRRASLAVLLGAVLYVGEYVLYSTLFHQEVAAFRKWIDAPANPDGTRPTLVLPHSVAAVSVGADLLSLGLLVVGILVVIWLYQAATFALRAGLPARRSPVWAVVGWIIPIVSFWFPYQSTVDLFPPGHPGRRKVGRWWALWLVTQGMVIVVVIGSFFSEALALAFALAGAVVAFAAAFAFRDVVAEVDRVHAGVLGR